MEYNYEFSTEEVVIRLGDYKIILQEGEYSDGVTDTPKKFGVAFPRRKFACANLYVRQNGGKVCTFLFLDEEQLKRTMGLRYCLFRATPIDIAKIIERIVEKEGEKNE